MLERSKVKQVQSTDLLFRLRISSPLTQQELTFPKPLCITKFHDFRLLCFQVNAFDTRPEL
jgi:hypothetical protein